MTYNTTCHVWMDWMEALRFGLQTFLNSVLILVNSHTVISTVFLLDVYRLPQFHTGTTDQAVCLHSAFVQRDISSCLMRSCYLKRAFPCICIRVFYQIRFSISGCTFKWVPHWVNGIGPVHAHCPLSWNDSKHITSAMLYKAAIALNRVER